MSGRSIKDIDDLKCDTSRLHLRTCEGKFEEYLLKPNQDAILADLCGSQHFLPAIIFAMLHGCSGFQQDTASAWGILRQLEQVQEKHALFDVSRLRSVLWLRAECLYWGEGVTADAKRAFTLYLQSAENGWLPAMADVAWRYRRGDGVEVNEDLAVPWYRRAAARNHPWAAESLARCFLEGGKCGLAQDFGAAHYWYSRAKQHGSLIADDMLTRHEALQNLQPSASEAESTAQKTFENFDRFNFSYFLDDAPPALPLTPLAPNELRRIPWSSLKVDMKDPKSIIGQGSFGVAYLGEWTGAQVVIKVPHPTEINTVEKQKGFEQEALLLQQLSNHPCIVRCVGTVIEPEQKQYAIVLEYASNGTAEKCIVKNKQFSSGSLSDQRSLVSILRDVASALKFLHEDNKIVHRDIAARNVLLDGSYQARLNDFGMSRRFQNECGQSSAQTGPVPWMSPESLSKFEYSPASDMWMFGVLVYELWTHSTPYDGQNTLDVGAKVKNTGSYLVIPSTAPPQIQKLITSCLAFQPKDRLTASQAWDLLDGFRKELSAFSSLSSSVATEVDVKHIYNTPGMLGSSTNTNANTESKAKVGSQQEIKSQQDSKSQQDIKFSTSNNIYNTPGAATQSTAATSSNSSTSSGSTSSGSTSSGNTIITRPADLEELLKQLDLSKFATELLENHYELETLLKTSNAELSNDFTELKIVNHPVARRKLLHRLEAIRKL